MRSHGIFWSEYFRVLNWEVNLHWLERYSTMYSGVVASVDFVYWSNCSGMLVQMYIYIDSCDELVLNSMSQGLIHFHSYRKGVRIFWFLTSWWIDRDDLQICDFGILWHPVMDLWWSEHLHVLENCEFAMSWLIQPWPPSNLRSCEFGCCSWGTMTWNPGFTLFETKLAGIDTFRCLEYRLQVLNKVVSK